jgi:threonine dehydrogenase-like Zn-dependent dehydrogenase
VGSPLAARLAVDLVRPGGIISTVGVHTASQFSFSPVDAFNKNLTYKIGCCPTHHYAGILIHKNIAQQYRATDIITHRFNLSEGKEAYHIFDKKEENCLKAILKI